MNTIKVTPYLRALVVLTAIALTTSTIAQPEADGIRLNRFAAKTPETLAQKPGGPTERIEIQSTTDNIDYVVRAFPLKNANAAEAYQWILSAVTMEGGTVDRYAPGSAIDVKGLDDVDVSYSGESILVVTAPEWMMEGIEQTIETIDIKGFHSFDYGNAAAWYRPKHRKASELADLIAGAAASGVELIVADDSRNILYIEDVPSFYAFDLEGFATYDVPPYQLDTRVRIYELSDDDVKDIGLDWYSWKKSINDGSLNFAWDNSSGLGSYDLDLQGITAELSFSPALATEFLNYLVSNGKATVINDTRMSLVNGTPGLVHAIEQIPFQIKGGTSDGNLFETAEAGVTVEIDPSIASDTIELTINASVMSHLGYTPTDGFPIISSSVVSSTVIMEPGKPAVVGGLTRTTKVSERSGIPGLKSIPVLKYAFSREFTRTSKSQILITVVPTTMSPGTAPADVPDEALPVAMAN